MYCNTQFLFYSSVYTRSNHTQSRCRAAGGQDEARFKVTSAILKGLSGEADTAFISVMLGETFTRQSSPIILIHMLQMVSLAFHLQPILNEKSIHYLKDNGKSLATNNHFTERMGILFVFLAIMSSSNLNMPHHSIQKQLYNS